VTNDKPMLLGASNYFKNLFEMC